MYSPIGLRNHAQPCAGVLVLVEAGFKPAFTAIVTGYGSSPNPRPNPRATRASPLRGWSGPQAGGWVWQRSYCEHMIRDDADLKCIPNMFLTLGGMKTRRVLWRRGMGG